MLPSLLTDILNNDQVTYFRVALSAMESSYRNAKQESSAALIRAFLLRYPLNQNLGNQSVADMITALDSDAKLSRFSNQERLFLGLALVQAYANISKHTALSDKKDYWQDVKDHCLEACNMVAFNIRKYPSSTSDKTNTLATVKKTLEWYEARDAEPHRSRLHDLAFPEPLSLVSFPSDEMNLFLSHLRNPPMPISAFSKRWLGSAARVINNKPFQEYNLDIMIKNVFAELKLNAKQSETPEHDYQLQTAFRTLISAGITEAFYAVKQKNPLSERHAERFKGKRQAAYMETLVANAQILAIQNSATPLDTKTLNECIENTSTHAKSLLHDSRDPLLQASIEERRTWEEHLARKEGNNRRHGI